MGVSHDGVCQDVFVELTQTRLIVDDFAAAFRYYRDVLGLPPQFDGGQPPHAGLKPAGGAVSVYERAVAAPPPQFDGGQPPYAAFKPAGGGTLALHDRTDLADVL